MRYETPESVGEAVGLLADDGPRGRVLAGGTDLLVQLRAGVISPDVIIDIKGIGETREIRENGGVLVVGAAVTGARRRRTRWRRRCGRGWSSPPSSSARPRSRAGRPWPAPSATHPPAADTVPALIAAAATCTVAGPNGTRSVPVEDVCTGPGQLSLGKGEFVVAFELPKPPPRSADAYLRFIPRTEMDIAVVGAGVSLSLDEDGRCTAARVALGAVAPTAILVEEAGAALIGTDCGDAAIEATAAAARAACRPIDDKRGTAEYRTKVAGVLAARTARIAVESERECMMAKAHVTTTVNGDPVEFLCDVEQTLLDVLRDELRLTGSKEGCASGDCGACSVIVDGRLVCACLMLGVEAQGHSVETIEGMATGDRLHPLQTKFLEHAALQCGVCTPGFLVAAKSLLDRNPDPTETECATGWPATSAGAPAMTRSCAPCWTRRSRCGRPA